MFCTYVTALEAYWYTEASAALLLSFYKVIADKKNYSVYMNYGTVKQMQL